jgi:hypothetical protein
MKNDAILQFIFVRLISTSTGSAWYSAKILHHSYVYNSYFTKLQGCCIRLSLCRIADLLAESWHFCLFFGMCQLQTHRPAILTKFCHGILQTLRQMLE